MKGFSTAFFHELQDRRQESADALFGTLSKLALHGVAAGWDRAKLEKESAPIVKALAARGVRLFANAGRSGELPARAEVVA